MDKLFHPTLNWVCDYLSMLALKVRDPTLSCHTCFRQPHDDVMKWKRFPHYWFFVRRSHRSSVIPSTKGQQCEPSGFLWCQSEQTVKQTFEWPVIWDAMTFCDSTVMRSLMTILNTLQWSNGVSNHWQHVRLFNNLFRLPIWKTSKLHITEHL